MKYNYYELKKNKVALPEDVNKPVEVALHKIFVNDELLKALVESREKRRFEEIHYGDDKAACEVQFVNGIIPRYFLIGRKPAGNGQFIVTRRSVNNDNLIFQGME